MLLLFLLLSVLSVPIEQCGFNCKARYTTVGAIGGAIGGIMLYRNPTLINGVGRSIRSGARYVLGGIQSLAGKAKATLG